MAIEESSIVLDFPDNNYFRLQDCEGYKQIQNNLKEMDVCWYDANSDVLYLIELKDWGSNTLEEEQDQSRSQSEINEMKKSISKYRIRNLFEKSIATTCMFMSMLLKNSAGLEINKCAPFQINQDTKIKLLSIINWIDSDTSYVSNINTEYKSKFNPYAKLFNIKVFLVLTKDKAAEQFKWIR